VDFSDEPYVRKYTRKTATNRLLGWEGRAVLDAMLGEFDPAGVFDFRGDLVRSIAAVTEIPEEIIRVALERLVETETWIVHSRQVVWPTYEEAQNCKRSDRARQRVSRKERASKVAAAVTTVPSARVAVTAPANDTRAVTEDPIGVTNVTASHSRSQPVTAGHSESQHVTLPPSAPSHPSSHPSERDPERARAAPPGPGLELVAGGGVARTYTMPGEDPPPEYLDEATLRAVPREQAISTWKHYFGAGLPERGVERLHAWLCQRAKERVIATAGVTPTWPEGRRRHGSAQPDAGKTGWEWAPKPEVVP
jgi:hypothetical protein